MILSTVFYVLPFGVINDYDITTLPVTRRPWVTLRVTVQTATEALKHLHNYLRVELASARVKLRNGATYVRWRNFAPHYKSNETQINPPGFLPCDATQSVVI